MGRTHGGENIDKLTLKTNPLGSAMHRGFRRAADGCSGCVMMMGTECGGAHEPSIWI